MQTVYNTMVLIQKAQFYTEIIQFCCFWKLKV